jgi:DNA transposition AAA+ family ATPase
MALALQEYQKEESQKEYRQEEPKEEKKAGSGALFPAPPDWQETPTARKIFDVLHYSHATGSMSIIYGASGIGKSSTLKYYAGLHNWVWLTSLSPARRSVVAALEEIAICMGITDLPYRASFLEREVISRLRMTGGLLIVDEADHGTVAVMETLRLLRDTTKIGVVLVGNERLYTLLTGGGSRTASAARLFARIGKRLNLKKVLMGDVVKVAKAYGISGKNELALVKKIGSTPGALHAVSETLRLAAVLAAGSNEALSSKHIRAAWADLAGE